MGWTRKKIGRTITFKDVNDFNIENSNHYRYNSTRTQIVLMNIKSDLLFKGYIMERSEIEGRYYINAAGKNKRFRFDWEYLTEATAEEVIAYVKSHA